MINLNVLFRKALLCCSLLMAENQLALAQMRNESAAPASMDSAMSILNTLPPEQLQTLLTLAMNSLPPEKKNLIEESLMTMKATKPEIKTIKLKNKTVSFIALSHASSPEFYDGVMNTVKDYKSKGYVVYYEQLRKEKERSKDNIDTLQLKLRKAVGLDPSRQTYSILKKFFPKAISQPEYKDLGVTDADVNADVTITQFIDYYEGLYGKVILTPCDFNTKSEAILYTCDKLNNNLDPVVLDYRNKFVAGLIKTSNHKKILVLYGARHIPGMIDLIQER